MWTKSDVIRCVLLDVFFATLRKIFHGGKINGVDFLPMPKGRGFLLGRGTYTSVPSAGSCC